MGHTSALDCVCADLTSNSLDDRGSLRGGASCWRIACQMRRVMVEKYGVLFLPIAALVFAAFFWCFSDPITGILGAMIALVVQMIFFAFVTVHTPEGEKT